MYLTASRPDIMFAVCACSRFQVTPKTSHVNAVKRIFRYLKGKPKLDLWYPRVSSFDLEAYSDSDYAGANLDRKSTIGGCQFLGRRLISWQCKKLTIMATSTTEAEYVAAANCFRRWTLDDMMMIWGSLYLFLRATYGVELVSAASLINTARPKLSTARLGWCYSKVFNNGVDAWIGLKMHFGLDLRNTTTSKTVNSVKQIHAIVNDMAVVISESLVRNDLLFDDEDDLPEPFNDTYETPCHTKKVFINMARKGVKYSGKVTPLFDSMLVPYQALEGEGSEQPTEPQPTPSPTHPSTGDQPPFCLETSKDAQAAEILKLKWIKSRSFEKELPVCYAIATKGKKDSAVEPRTPPKQQNIEDSSRPARSILTLKPLLIINPKDKGKSVLEEPEPAKKTIEKRKDKGKEDLRLAYMLTYDEVQEGIDADALFAAKLQQEEREEYTIEERAKFLAETIAAQRKFRATQRSAKIRSRPPTKSYPKATLSSDTSHSEPMDSDDAVKDSKEAAGVHKQKVREEPNSTKVEVKQEGYEESIKKRPGRRLKMKETKKKSWRRGFQLLTGNQNSMILTDMEQSASTIESLDLWKVLVLWGDLRDNVSDVNTEDEHCSEDGTEIHMLAERKYLLIKETNFSTYRKLTSHFQNLRQDWD
ncbi:hypothetical protein Tco_1457279 [Tanacetum coccineum]